MSGLDKIKDRILGEAKDQAKEKIKAAEEKAGEIKSKAVQDAEAVKKDTASASDLDVKKYDEKVASSIDMERRTRILGAKQELITGVLESALEKIRNLSDKDYFDLLLKLVEKNASAEEGEIIFSEKDVKRMPEGFPGEVKKAAQANGGTLTISGEARDIDGGFILSYGGVEENCTFEAMFEAKKDDLSDIVSTILFS